MRLTSGGLSSFARGPGLPLIGVGRAVELRRAHVEEQRLLEVVHHGQAVAVPEHHPETQGHVFNRTGVTLCHKREEVRD